MVNKLEKLTVDLLEDDFVRVFDALHLQQRILGTLRVYIKYGFATTPTNSYVFYKIIIWIVISLSHIAFIFQCETAEGAVINDFYLKLALTANNVITLIVILLYAFKNNYHTFYVKLQKIDKELHMKNKKVNRYLSLFIRSSCVVTSILGILWNYLFHFKVIKVFCLSGSAVLIPGMGNFVDLTIILVIIVYLIIRLRYINSKLKNILENHQKNAIEYYSIDIESIAHETNIWNNLLNGMNAILAVINDFTELFQYQIFCFTCQVLIWNIVIIQCVILILINRVPVNSTQAILTTSILVTIILYFIILCAISEYFSSELIRIRKFCIDILSSSLNDDTRRNAKRMLLLINLKNDLSVYDIYTLDLRLLTNALAIITTYTIILLQFDLT